MRLSCGMTMIGLALLAGGCSPARRNDTVPVTGVVTLGGQPIEAGDICFKPDDAQQGVTGARIERGRYSGQAPTGRNRVLITASGTTAASPIVEGVRLPVNIVPACYNVDTTLSAEVVAGRVNTFDFVLEPNPGTLSGERDRRSVGLPVSQNLQPGSRRSE